MQRIARSRSQRTHPVTCPMHPFGDIDLPRERAPSRRELSQRLQRGHANAWMCDREHVGKAMQRKLCHACRAFAKLRRFYVLAVYLGDFGIAKLRSDALCIFSAHRKTAIRTFCPFRRQRLGSGASSSESRNSRHRAWAPLALARRRSEHLLEQLFLSSALLMG